MKHLSTLMQTTRPNFLILTPVCVLLGLSLCADAWQVSDITVWLIMLGALCAHISVNMLNEYHDFTSSLDLHTNKTPFSGGSGALPANPSAAKAVFITGVVTLLITIAIGIYFIALKGMDILPIGIIGVLVVVCYTRWINRIPVLCLIASGLGFGLLMVLGTYVVITGELNTQVVVVSLIPFLLINNLLLLNQYPDITADAKVGRRTLPIAYGISVSNAVYAVQLIGAYMLLVYTVFTGQLALFSLIALAPAFCGVTALYGALTYRERIAQKNQYLAMNVISAITTPLLLALSILLV